MAYTVIRAENGGDASQGYYYEYLCASADDVADLPTEATNGGPRPGSLAYIESDSSARYILKVEREWGEYPMASGGGGGNSGILWVTEDTNTGELDTTWQTIHDAIVAGQLVFIKYVDVTEVSQVIICAAAQDNEATKFDLYINFNYTDVVYTTDNATGYPVAAE